METRTAGLLPTGELKQPLGVALLAVALAATCAYFAIWTSTFELVGDGFGERCEQTLAGRSGPFDWSWDMSASGVEVSCRERGGGASTSFEEFHLWPIYLWRSVGMAIFVGAIAFLVVSWASVAIRRRLGTAAVPNRALDRPTDRYRPIALGFLVAASYLVRDHLVTMARARLPYQPSVFVSPLGVPAAAMAGSLLALLGLRFYFGRRTSTTTERSSSSEA